MKTDHVDSLARGLVVRASSSVEDRQLVAGWLEAEHFLGALRAVGHTLIQFVQQENQVVAVVCCRLRAVKRLRAFERNCSPWPASEPSPTSRARFSSAQ